MYTPNIEKLFDILVSEWYMVIISWSQSRDEIYNIRSITLKSDSLENLWYRQYRENLSLILKYQKDTLAPSKNLLQTMFHLVGAYVNTNANKVSCKDYSLLWLLSLLQYVETYWMEKPPHEADFDNIDLEVESNSPQKKHYRTIWYYFLCALYKYKWIEIIGWEKMMCDWDFCKITEIVYEIIGPEVWEIMYVLAPSHISFGFCIVYTAHYRYKQFINEKVSDVTIFSIFQFSINNHPYADEEYSNIKKYVAKCKENYIGTSEESGLYKDFVFDCGLLNLLKKNESKELLYEIREFKSRYVFIAKRIRNPRFTILWIDEKYYDQLIRQRLYFDMLDSIYHIKSLLSSMKIVDFRVLFDYLNNDINYHHFWHKHKAFLLGDEKNKKRWNIIELSRIFLFKKIRQKEFDRIHSIYEQTKSEPLFRNIYNLVLWKFSLAFVKIWVDYFTEWYHILLKQMFKNFWLQTPGHDLENFNLPKEAANDLGSYELENDEDIRDLIFNDEGIELEIKASIFLDRKKYLVSNKKQELPESTYLKPLVSFLNTKWGNIVLWLWEWNKLDEELLRWDITLEQLKNKWLNKYPKANNHYLTWVDEDLTLKWLTEDNMKQQIDQYIKNNVYPDPFISSCTIQVTFKKFLGKKICILSVPQWSTEYFLQNNSSWTVIHKLYVRQNGSDREIKDPKEITEYIKGKRSLATK